MSLKGMSKVFYFVLINLVTVAADQTDGDYIVGAILPIRTKYNGTCSQVNYEGIAVAEAIRFAVAEINSDHKLLGKFTTDRSLGYDIRDTCNSIEKEKDIAYAFNEAKRKSRNTPGLIKAVSIVIGRFTKESLSVMRLLNFEQIAQFGFDKNNVNLQQIGLKSEDANNLLSTYPEDQSKSNAIVSLISSMKFEFTSFIVTDNGKGRAFLRQFQHDFKKANKCYMRNKLVKSEDDIKNEVAEIAKNSNVRVVVLYGDKKDELVAIEEFARLNITRVIFISSNSWKLDEIKNYASQVEGMISVASDTPDVNGFSNYLEDENKPILSDPELLKEVLKQMGAKGKCAAVNATLPTDKSTCRKIRKTLIEEMMKYKTSIAYTIDAVYAFANGVQSMLNQPANKTKKLSLTESMIGLDFQSPITRNRVQFNQDKNAMAQSFSLHNMHGNTSLELKTVEVGNWKRDKEERFSIKKALLKWKDGRKKIPLSKCSHDCVQGEQIQYPKNAPMCCWSCLACPKNTFSNMTNSNCSRCPALHTPNAEKSKCHAFQQSHLTISSPLAEFAMFLMVIGLLFTLISMFIMNQNKECKVMKVADNETMQILLFGCLLILLSSLILLFKPTVNICIIYACAFNIALTIPLAALITKTWAFHSVYYNDDGSMKQSCFGSRPGFCVGVIILLLHVLLLGVGLYYEGVWIYFEDTEKWNVKYIECSLFRNYLFWLSYGFNIALSIFTNVLNCSVPNVEAHFREYNWLCLTSCVYYTISFIYIIDFFALELLTRVEVAIVITVLHAFVFLLSYILPKLHMTLFMNERMMEELSGKKHHEKEPLMVIDIDDYGNDEALMQMVAHAGGGDIFKQKKKMVQTKVRRPTDEEEEEEF
eukprot:gene8714-9645_t